eukprot:TRINITY_DN39985_c0_g1_i1.p1 TRINITY_DN39985_c0_g1~~TRINITY_DN39985_c0_g1_i1.p1  ORF type:complete len:301 (+),score=47.09 TRINITY_DN39985_c0_g1_i1:42-944(+)
MLDHSSIYISSFMMLTAVSTRPVTAWSVGSPSSVAGTSRRSDTWRKVSEGPLHQRIHSSDIQTQFSISGVHIFAASVATAVCARALQVARKRRFACRSAARTLRLATSSTNDPARRKVLVPVANDSEEIETACITDVLKRAGADVTVASVETTLQVKMSRGLKVVADTFIGECAGQDWDAIALPGGMPGAERLRDNKELVAMLKKQKESGRLTAAVCASPAVVFAEHRLLNQDATCYPAPKFKELIGENWKDAEAVVDGNIVTSQGPGTSLQFALKIVELLFGLAKAEELAAQLLTTRSA